ncbi:MAG: hypothetical protein WBZ05_18175, partial [Desulfobacterales bacterium]
SSNVALDSGFSQKAFKLKPSGSIEVFGQKESNILIGQIIETVKCQSCNPCLAVSVLGKKNFRYPLIRLSFIIIVNFISVQKNNHIGILLKRSRFEI